MERGIDYRDIDCEIAERMGWVVGEDRTYMRPRPGFGMTPQVPQFCMDRRAGVEFIQFLENHGFRFSVESTPVVASPIKMYTAKFERAGITYASEQYERESLAVAMAALKALGSSVAEIMQKKKRRSQMTDSAVC